MKRAPENDSPVANEEGPHLPGFCTWRGVYWFVMGCFILFVVLLALLSRAYS
ncbi:MAG TPA: hypothetical protein VH255_01755 [Verrucomicrobiae bacterium]|jgi:hypothetical protein|nr:hypothetical protein [Verrucomicrobiae bacterium]